MKIDFSNGWQQLLNKEFHKPYFIDLMQFVDEEYQSYTCYPKQEDIFAAFKRCPLNDVSLIIIGQDPYHGQGQANGLCFSVKDDVVHPPSLRNIFKELETDVGKPYPKSGNLESWAEQGVLLLNATLTVRANEPGSHQKKGWETFTDAIIKKLSLEKENLIFLLWGGFAKKKASLINQNRHSVLTAGHPSPLSANRGFWFGNQHFSKSNIILEKQHNKKINW